MDFILSVILIVLVFCSAFFACSETGMMSLNRYRLRHLAERGDPQAQRAQRLLKRPDRLLSVLLIGNTVANIVSSALLTIIASHYFGELGMIILTCFFTLFVLVFAEVLPKTIAALNPERIAFPTALPLTFLLTALYPLVLIVNGLSNLFLKPFGATKPLEHADALTTDELRTVVGEASSTHIATRHKYMLLGVLDLDNVTVRGVMTPRNQVVGLDLTEPWPHIYKVLVNSRFSKLPVYEGSLDHIVGVLHVRSALSLIGESQLNADRLRKLLRPAYYIPESTSLQQQLVKFQDTGEQLGIVVDEYGDVQGIATLGDIVEEIVGEITDHHQALDAPYYRLKSGAYIIDGGITIRDINRYCHFNLPTEGPKTLSGLIIERMQTIPIPKTSLVIADHMIEILSVEDNAVQKTKIQKVDSVPD